MKRHKVQVTADGKSECPGSSIMITETRQQNLNNRERESERGEGENVSEIKIVKIIIIIIIVLIRKATCLTRLQYAKPEQSQRSSRSPSPFTYICFFPTG
jgi:hypothetical protein